MNVVTETKTALVTGAARRIGRAIAQSLADRLLAVFGKPRRLFLARLRAGAAGDLGLGEGLLRVPHAPARLCMCIL